MRLLAPVFVLLCCLVAGPTARSQDYQELAGLNSVDIVVENLSSQSMGLTTDNLKGQLFVGLKRDIPKLKIDDNAPAYIYLRIITIKFSEVRGYAACVELSLRRPAALSDGAHLNVPATVWQKLTLMTGAPENAQVSIKQTVDEFLTSFAAAYYKNNQ